MRAFLESFFSFFPNGRLGEGGGECGEQERHRESDGGGIKVVPIFFLGPKVNQWWFVLDDNWLSKLYETVLNFL